MTAEFAVLLPVIVALLALCVLLVQLAGMQVRLASEAASAARMLARGDSSSEVASLLGEREPGVRLETRRDGELVCAELERAVQIGPFGIGSFAARAEGCSLDGSGG